MESKIKTRRFLTVGCAYLLTLATVVSILLSLSNAKYRTLLTGYAGFNPESFNGAIFDGTTDSQIASGDPSVRHIGTGTQLVDCYPGMEPREYPFVIANGKDVSSFATADVEFYVKVRTMMNIPLEYKLIEVNDEGEPIEDAEYATALTPKKLKRDSETAIDGRIFGDDDGDGKTNDTYWYEYSFVDSAATAEQRFVLTGGDLTVRHFVLQVTWPIDEEKGTNSPDYQKEVELIQLVACLTSVNYQEEENHGQPEQEIVIDPEGEGMLILDPDHADAVYTNGTDTVYTYDHTVSYRAFMPVSGVSGKYAYKFSLTNGNNLYKYDEDGNRLVTQPYDYSYFKVRMTVPYETDTASYTYALTATASDGSELVYPGKVIEYRKYDVLYNSDSYGEYEVLTKDQADTLVAAVGTDAYTEQYAVYCVYEFTDTDPSTGTVSEKITSLYNNNRYAEQQFTLTVSAGTSIAVENATRRVNYKLTLTAIAVHCNDPMETPAIPDGYEHWGEEGGAQDGD